MSALDDIRKKVIQDMSEIEYCLYRLSYVNGHCYDSAVIAATELAELRDTITHDKAMLANDGIVLLECLKLLGLDVSGADTHDIPKAIEAMKVRLERLETVATDVNEWMIRCNMGGTAHQRSLEAALQKGE